MTEETLTWREHDDLKLRKDRANAIIYQSLSKEYRTLISSTTASVTTATANKS